MAYARSFGVALGSSQTSLTLLATLIDQAGTLDGTIKDVTSGFTEIGVGNYQWYYATIPDAFRGLAVFHVGTIGAGSDFTGVTVKAVDQINAEVSNNPWALTPRTLTQTAAEVAAIVSGTTLTVTRGNHLSFSLTGLGDLTGNTDVIFSAKRSYDEADSASQVRVSRTVGLEVIDGTVATAANGSLVVDDVTAGDITVTIKTAASQSLKTMDNGVYDVKWADASGLPLTLTAAIWKCTGDVTRAI